jgi:hypothetical protein
MAQKGFLVLEGLVTKYDSIRLRDRVVSAAAKGDWDLNFTVPVSKITFFSLERCSLVVDRVVGSRPIDVEIMLRSMSVRYTRAQFVVHASWL